MKRLAISAVVMSLIAGTSFAVTNVEITGTIPATVQINHTSNNHSMSAKSQQKHIKLLRVSLSPQAKAYLAKQAEQTTHLSFAMDAATAALPARASAGMNNVPVLDQGVHSTCATFATTGAIDAIHGNTDYVSQLCNLEFGAYIEQEMKKEGKRYPSGWDGSLNEIVLAQMKAFGIVSMRAQRQGACGSLREYPLYDETEHGAPLSDTDFARVSEPVMKDVDVKKLLGADEAFSSKANKNTVLNNVKKALSNGNRVVFGTLLDVNESLANVSGATGTYMNVRNDSWIMTPQIRNDLIGNKIKAGHAMVITGYDDNAVITGPGNTRHKGVLTLRNSWSSDAGNKGDYYMSYEFFKLMVMEAFEVSPKSIN